MMVMKKKLVEKDREDKEIDWILKNALKFAEGRFGHHVVVIKDRKVIFRVKGNNEAITAVFSAFGIPMVTPEEDQRRDIEKALRMVKKRFGEPELIKMHMIGADEVIASLHYKDGTVLYVFGFTAM